MSLSTLPTELILAITVSLPCDDLARLLRVNRRFYDLLPQLYKRYLESCRHPRGFFRSIAIDNEAAVRHFLTYGVDVNAEIDGDIPTKEFPDLPGYREVYHASLEDIYTTIPIDPWFRVQTPLSIAANTGNDSLVALLLSHGAEVNPTPSGGLPRPAVGDALLSGHESTVRFLIMNGSPFHGPETHSWGLVDDAIRMGRLSLLKLLIELGADLNICREGCLPLQRALRSTTLSTDIVKLLLDNGADMSALEPVTSGRELSGLLHRAIQESTLDTVHLLLNRGARIPSDILDTSVHSCTLEIVRLMLERGCVPTYQTLAWVVKTRRRDILQYFIDYGVDLNMKNERGWTILHSAIKNCGIRSPPVRIGTRGCRRPGRPIMMRHIEQDPQPFSATCVLNKDELEEVVCTREEIVLCLIRGGADLNTLDPNGEGPLALAGKYAPAIQQMLVDEGCEN